MMHFRGVQGCMTGLAQEMAYRKTAIKITWIQVETLRRFVGYFEVIRFCLLSIQFSFSAQLLRWSHFSSFIWIFIIDEKLCLCAQSRSHHDVIEEFSLRNE